MPVTVATSYLVISLNALVRPNSRHRDAALLFARSRGDDEELDGDHGDSDSDSSSDSEEDSRRLPLPPTTSPSTSQTRTVGIMSTSQSGTGGSSAGQGGTTIAFETQSSSVNSSSTTGTITTTTSPLPFFSQSFDPLSLSTPTTSSGTVSPFGTSNRSSSVRISNGAIIGMTLGIVFLAALIWMSILKMVKRRRRARKQPRGFIPSTIIVDNQSFRASVTELPVAGTTNTTTTSVSNSNSSNGRAMSLSPFAALRVTSPSPPPQNPPPPPGLSLRRSSQQTLSSSHHPLSKAMSTRSLRREERAYPEEDPLYLAIPPTTPPPPSTGPRGAVRANAESAPHPATSSLQTGLPTLSYASYDHPYRTTTGFQQNEYDGYYDAEEEGGHSHRDPPPSYGQAF
ncbi:hypothetical protein NMY22_g1981 [Coprinellus aureogranulatus]|nr:hypothetical protein NMY22_g1981 [Coprinellus aureogranulatus]